MDGLSSPPDLEHELSELRARAYGPLPDIQDDPAALARLRELEEAHTRSAAMTDADARAPAMAAAGPRLVHVGAFLAAEAAGTDSTAAGGRTRAADPLDEVSASQVPPRRLTASRRVMLTSAAVVIVLALAYVVTWLLQPHPDATLRPIETSVGDEVPGLYAIAFREVDTSTLRAYESYRGLEPLVAVNERGWVCLIAINLEDRVFFGIDCPPPGADPFIEVPVLAGRDDFFEGEVPEGSVIRLILHDDVVSVFLHPAPPAD